MVDYIFVSIFEFAIALVGLVIAAIPLLKRHFQRPKESRAVSLYLLLTIIFLLAAVLMAGISRVVRMVVWPQSTMDIELLAFSVSFVAISDLFMLSFTLEVFREKASKNKVALLVCTACVAAYIVFTVSTGLYDVDLNDTIWFLVIILSVVVAVFLTRSALQLSRKVEEPVGKWGLRFMAMGPVFLIITYVLFLVDSFLGGQFTPFYYAAWIVAIVFVLFVYIGFVQPEWFKKRFQRKGN